MKNDRDSLRKYLNKKPPYKLYAYIYRSHITKKQILKHICPTWNNITKRNILGKVKIENMESESKYIRSLTMMQLCCYNKNDVIEAIVDIKLPYVGRRIQLC